jgi:hypothetical protein
MKPNSLRFYSVLAVLLAMALLGTLPGVVQAEGEDDIYSGWFSAWGYTPDGYGCYLSVTYRNNFVYPRNPYLHVRQYPLYAGDCNYVDLHLYGDDVPKDLISLKGPVGEWFAYDYLYLVSDEFACSLDVTTDDTYIGEGKTTYYPSGDIEGHDIKVNNFHVNSIEVQGTIYDQNAGGYGGFTKYEYD